MLLLYNAIFLFSTRDQFRWQKRTIKVSYNPLLIKKSDTDSTAAMNRSFYKLST